jgi:hypothetical protein
MKMNSRVIHRFVFGGAVALFCAAVVTCVAQQPLRKAPARKGPDPYAETRETYEALNMRGDKGKFLKMPGGPGTPMEIRKAAEVLRDAESDDDKEKAEAKLRNLLSKQFETDMERRQSELEQLAERLEKLKQQLERRREKMAEIVDLQMKVLVNEADGLGFFSGDPMLWESSVQPLPNDLPPLPKVRQYPIPPAYVYPGPAVEAVSPAGAPPANLPAPAASPPREQR